VTGLSLISAMVSDFGRKASRTTFGVADMARPFSNASLARRAPVARARAGALYGIAFQSVAVTRQERQPRRSQPFSTFCT
jgi:hypothetical protein